MRSGPQLTFSFWPYPERVLMLLNVLFPLIELAWMDPQKLIEFFGPWVLPGVAAVLFIETGLLFPILPGDSLLFTVGMLTTSGVINHSLWFVCVVLFVAAFAGDQCGYLIGKFAGPKIFRREDSRFFKQSYIDQTYEFFDKYGGRAIILARFVPIVRTYIPVAAGIGHMPYRHFVPYNAIGGLLWAVGVTLLGAGLGNFSFIKNNLELILILIVFISVLPMIIEIWRAKRTKRNPDYDTETERRAVMDQIVDED